MWCAHALSANFYFALVCHEFILFVVSQLIFQQVPTFQRAYLVAKKNSFSHVQFIKLQIFSNEKLFSIFSTCVSFMLMICVMQTTYLSLSQSNQSKRLRFSFFFYWKDILTHISLFFNLVVKKTKIREEDNVERVYICQIMSARRVYRSKSKL